MRQRDFTTVFLAAAMGVTTALPVFLLAALFPQISTGIAAPWWTLGVIVASYWIAAATSSFFAGRITARIGPSRSGLLAIGLVVVSLLGAGLLSPNWVWLLVWSALGGAANGLCHPSANYLVVVRVQPRHHSFAFGIKQSAVPLATLLAGLAIPIFALTLGWRWAPAAGALLALLLLAVLGRTVFIDNHALSAGRARAADRRPARISDRPAAGRSAKDSAEALPSALVSSLLLLSCTTGFGAAGATILSTYAVVSAIDQGIAPATAGALLGTAGLTAAVTRIVSGALMRSDESGALTLTALMLVVSGVGTVLLLVESRAVFAVGLACSLGIGWGWPGLVHYAISRIAGRATPRATGMVQTGTYLGCTFGPLLAGTAHWIWEERGVWFLCALFLLAASAFAAATALRSRSAPRDTA